jgi:alkylated DNA nucleotide flippase Atl1
VGKIKPYFKSRGYPFTVILDTDSQISRVLKPGKGLPSTIVVNKNGDIVLRHEGYKKGEEKLLEEKILSCIAEAEKPKEAK